MGQTILCYLLFSPFSFLRQKLNFKAGLSLQQAMSEACLYMALQSHVLVGPLLKLPAQHLALREAVFFCSRPER